MARGHTLYVVRGQDRLYNRIKVPKQYIGTLIVTSTEEDTATVVVETSEFNFYIGDEVVSRRPDTP